MRKEDFILAVSEFYRVLKNGGLCYVNFLSEECDSFGKGQQIGQGQFIHIDDNESTLYWGYYYNTLKSYITEKQILDYAYQSHSYI